MYMEEVSESDLEGGGGGPHNLHDFFLGLQSHINARNPQNSSFFKVTNVTLLLGLMRDTIKKL